MPTYVYQEILPDGSDGEAFEYIQRMADEPLKTHPKTGNPVRKVFHSPNVSSKYTEGSTKNKLSDENVEKPVQNHGNVHGPENYFSRTW